MRRLYALGWWLAVPLALVYLLYRSIRQPEYRRHWGERFGFRRPAAAPGSGPGPGPGPGTGPGSRPIWIHAVSVGETAAAAPLLRRLASRYPDAAFLLTHGTPTGRQTGATLFADLGPRLKQCYLPYDLASAMARFLDAWQPRCGLIMETEVWPNLMEAARSRRVPMAAINARLSERSLRRGLRYRSLIAPAISAFDCIVAQSAADSARIARLARPADAIAGNLKFDQTVSEEARAAGRQWRRMLGARPVILAASTRDGEEALILQAWRDRQRPMASAGEGAAALLILVPRHPNRFEAVAGLIAAALPAARWRRRSALDAPTPDLADCDVLLGDSMGEMQRWYACADVTIMGGSLLPFGSQNLIEANALGCPVVLGPSVFNFEQAANESIAAGAAVQVADPPSAVQVALEIADDPARRAAMSAAAVGFAEAHRGATERTLTALAPLLQRSY